MHKTELIAHLDDALDEHKNRISKGRVVGIKEEIAAGPEEIADEEATEILKRVLRPEKKVRG